MTNRDTERRRSSDDICADRDGERAFGLGPIRICISAIAANGDGINTRCYTVSPDCNRTGGQGLSTIAVFILITANRDRSRITWIVARHRFVTDSHGVFGTSNCARTAFDRAGIDAT